MSQLRKSSCLTCGDEFTFKPSDRPGNYCSQDCAAIAKNPLVHRELLTYIYLHQAYIQERQSAQLIANELHASKTLILRHLKKFGISRRKPSGRVRNNLGYILIRAPEHPYASVAGYVFEHRLIIEKRIGRYLLPKERVHHLNHVRDDNRDENLYLMPSHSAHQRLHYEEDPEQFRQRAIKSGRKSSEASQKRFALWCSENQGLLCACGCGRFVNLTRQAYKKRNRHLFATPGCGIKFKSDQRFQSWLNDHTNILCACGCGNYIVLTKRHFHHNIIPKYIYTHYIRKKNH